MKKLRQHRPKEVYAAFAVLSFVLFLNPSELFTSSINPLAVFDVSRSFVAALLSGVTDRRFYAIDSNAPFVFWLLWALVAHITYRFRYQISDYIWNIKK